MVQQLLPPLQGPTFCNELLTSVSSGRHAYRRNGGSSEEAPQFQVCLWRHKGLF